MNPNLAFFAVCAAILAAAAIGWFAPPIRGRARLGEVSVWLASSAFALQMPGDWLKSCTLALVFPGTYYTFSAWHKEPKRAFHLSFLGAVWLYSLTTPTHHSLLWLTPWLLVIVGPAAARWLTEHTHRWVGLGLLGLATLFELSRVPFFFSS